MRKNFDVFDDYKTISEPHIHNCITNSKNITLETLFANMHETLANYGKSKKQSVEIVSHATTGKSLFGIVKLNGERKFFKIASAERIFGEIRGYVSANHYPHVGISGCYFDKKGSGLLIQPEFENLDDHLFLNESNRNLYKPSNKYLEQSSEIVANMGIIYKETLVELADFIGCNDDFFAKRLLPGGNIEKFYGSSTINVNRGGGEFTDLVINGVHIGTLLGKAKETFLDNTKERLYVESQGDPTEANIAFPNTYFDFETAGINALSQDIAIFLMYSFVFGHYLVPKPNHFETALTPEVIKFKESVQIGTIDINGNQIDFDICFDVPNAKKHLISEYNDRVIKPIEKILSPLQNRKLLEEVIAGMFMRLTAVKNLTKLEEQERLILLYLVSHFCSDKNKYTTLSEYVTDKFKSI